MNRVAAFGVLVLLFPGVSATAASDELKYASAAETAAAFKVAFGTAGAATRNFDAGAMRFVPGKMIWLPDGRAALLSPGGIKDAAHVASGRLALHYLKRTGTTYKVVKEWLNTGIGASMGAAPDFTLSAKLLSNPVILSEGGSMGQGYTCTVLQLVELLPAGPSGIGKIPFYFDNEGAAARPGQVRKITGKITNIKMNRSFDVSYTGSKRFTETWIRTAPPYTRFDLPKGVITKMESC